MRVRLVRIKRRRKKGASQAAREISQRPLTEKSEQMVPRTSQRYFRREACSICRRREYSAPKVRQFFLFLTRRQTNLRSAVHPSHYSRHLEPARRRLSHSGSFP